MRQMAITLLAAAMLAWASIAAPSPPVAQPTTDDTFITLGTVGGPITSPERSQPANVLLHGGNAYLIDAGDGAAQQLGKAGISLANLRAIFLSHLHLDHTGGVAAVLGLRYQANGPGVLTVYGPPGTKALIDGIVASMQPASEAGYGLPGEPRVVQATVKKIRRSRPDLPEAALQGIVKHITDHHLTPVQVGELASRAKVKRLVVTHLAPGTTSRADIDRYIKDIEQHFKGPAVVANDLERY